MPTSYDPIAPNGLRQFCVQLKGFDGCPSTGGNANDPAAICAPHEVFIPMLAAGIEEVDNYAGMWVRSFCLCPFVLIA